MHLNEGVPPAKWKSTLILTTTQSVEPFPALEARESQLIFKSIVHPSGVIDASERCALVCSLWGCLEPFLTDLLYNEDSPVRSKSHTHSRL